MNKTVGIIIAVVIALLGLGLVFYRRNDGGSNPITGGGCISVPSDFLSWSGSFLSTDWGAYGAARQQYLGMDPDDEAQRNFVDGFFKSINVEPRSNYVKHFAREIKAYINSTSALPHWEIPVAGYMRC
ncbi:hypothetical protein [Phaeodactylibacter sp.]|uniref:hypothetical protein n=1 Tax=Phaeodactylibacter sp. TaxID=1940289 RepID=UPI0025F52C4D|nr:hypothetical protein [Phaeodactylibacter sp.]MCI4650853.1 hypothetical protein [Phaeodactylibacter sp.]MCI5089810.1 hypothetical protein [Phaeodactylibacter sp.]